MLYVIKVEKLYKISKRVYTNKKKNYNAKMLGMVKRDMGNKSKVYQLLGSRKKEIRLSINIET